jgi:hypothetical protein
MNIPTQLVSGESAHAGRSGNEPAHELSNATTDDKLLCAYGDMAALAAGFAEDRKPLPQRVSLDPDKVERGLAQLVLTVIELLRQLVERQALRRVEQGTVNEQEIERMGLALMRLEERMDELKEIFGLSAEDLNLDLGPLGKLL